MAYVDTEKLKTNIRVNLMPNVDIDGTVAVEVAERYFLNLIDKTSTADAAEVKHGHWKNVCVFNDNCIAICSNCRQLIKERECNATAFKLENKFCRNCGAKMDE